jgi:hypothetical protein
MLLPSFSESIAPRRRPLRNEIKMTMSTATRPFEFCLRASVLAVSLFAVACGSEDPTPKDPGVDAQPLLPFAEGNRWVYRVTEGAVVEEKVNVVGPAEPVGGTGAFKDEIANKCTTSKQGGTDETISWQRVEGDRVVRYREQSFHAGSGALELEETWSPAKLRIDGSREHTIADASWMEDYEETKLPAGDDTPSVATRRDRWTVKSVGQTLTVLAGTFDDVIVIEKVGVGGLKTYYYKRGVGKLKETGGQTEELQSYMLVP